MPKSGDWDWDVVGLYSKSSGYVLPALDENGDRVPFTDNDIIHADNVQIRFEAPDGTEKYFTFHNDDIGFGWEELEHYVEDFVEDSSYFEA